MMNRPFTKPPLTPEEKEKKANEFIELSDLHVISEKNTDKTIPQQKESIKTLYLRAPQSYWDDIQEIMALTGLSMNAVCLELLRPAIKRKLKEIKEGG
jgi:hypothetical protein